MTNAPTTRETADHAELLRRALQDAQELSRRGLNPDVRLNAAERQAVTHLLSEIAALRGEVDKTERDYSELRDSYDAVSNKLCVERAHGSRQSIRATQAERQRDELRKALEPSPEMIRVGAWRAKLHREANPGDTWEDTVREVFSIMVAASDADVIANHGADQ